MESGSLSAGSALPGEVSFRPSLWREERAPRAAVLVDVADYYAALRSALASARRSVHFLNWAFESRTRLDPADQDSPRLGEILRRLAGRGVDVRVLVWRAALPVALSQNGYPQRNLAAFAGSPVRFVLDGTHPFGACHHQKVVVVDDSLAFCGGADLAQDRWDTSEHLDEDVRRRRPGSRKFFTSRREVMSVVDGAAAQALADLFRDRWLRATGESMDPPTPAAPAPWPQDLAADFSDVAVGLARTAPAWRGWPEIRECEALTLASIASARRSIYLENQYFTSPPVAEALAMRLSEEGGPEVILISTEHAPHWFDRMTMDRARVDFIRRLARADLHDRLHILSPWTRGGAPIIVHAKATILDDDFVRVGSTNLNNRSTGFDSECDLAFRLENDANRAAAETLRNRMVGHWFGLSAEEIAGIVRSEGGLGAALTSLLAGGDNALRPLRPKLLGPTAAFVAAFHLGDPVGPADSLRPLLRQRRLEERVEAVRRGESGRLSPSSLRRNGAG
jgi:phosphatidylserine/phosphatidylglycerophosphate/cardiolipin synthase-like enzyme